MKQVFISYTTHDLQRASAIRKMLEDNDISCWMGDKDIHASNTYTADITKAIEQCQVFILVLSSYSQESSYVHSEFECAIAKNKLIIPFIIENFRIKEEFNFHIRQRQAIAAFEDWKEGMNKLLETVKHWLSTESVPKKHTVTDVLWNNMQPFIGSQTSRKPPVLCPYCGCTILKRKQLFVDRYLYKQNHEFKKGQERIQLLQILSIKNGANLKVIINLLFAIMVLASIISIVNADPPSANGEYQTNLDLLFLTFLMAGFRFLASTAFLDSHFVAEALIKAISNSGFIYCTFKCAECEETFSILLPKEDKIEDHVERLLNNKKQN